MALLRISILVLLCFTGHWSCRNAAPSGTLQVGDPAPSLAKALWVKGAPVTTFEKGHIYVIDFGFIGCVPCMEAWPKLSDLQEKYGNKVTFIVVMTHMESISGVEKYLERMGDEIDINVVFDPRMKDDNDTQGRRKEWILDNRWNKATARALGKNSMPYPTLYFVDKKGQVAHIGNSRTNIEYVLGKLLNGEAEKAVPVSDGFRKERYESYKRNMRKGNLSEALEDMDRLTREFPREIKYKRLKFKLLLQVNEHEAYDYGREILNRYSWVEMNNAWDLSKSWSGLIRDGIITGNLQSPDYDLAIAMNLKSAALCGHDRLEALSYANAAEFFYMRGDMGIGEEVMNKAISSTPSAGDRDIFRVLLEKYRKIYGKQGVM
ncbi:TlpA family protein disulfide reductase [Sinomicrobium sp. M5D2P9]